jgi:hypothetical protein
MQKYESAATIHLGREIPRACYVLWSALSACLGRCEARRGPPARLAALSRPATPPRSGPAAWESAPKCITRSRPIGWGGIRLIPEHIESCGHRQRNVLSAWESLWLSDAQKHQLIERFVLGVPVYRQRFRPVCGANTAEKVYRLLRACCAYAEQWREPFTGALECDETTFGGARHGPRG